MSTTPKNIDQKVSSKYGENYDEITAHKCMLCGWYGSDAAVIDNHLTCPKCGYIFCSMEESNGTD